MNDVSELRKAELQQAIAKRLKLYRTRYYRNQAELAERLGVSRALYTMYETGRRKLALEVAMRIAEIDGLSLDAIYRGVLNSPRDVRIIGETEPNRDDDAVKKR